MKGQQPVSPRRYIETRARILPIYKCWVTSDWQEGGLADVIVARRHSNGHLTAGIYLVDLLCLGVKDTFFLFNEEEEDLVERLQLNSGTLQEIPYSLAHNIIYAGHDFAMEFDIHPHKDFLITKYILEEDTDDIPLIDIHTGDEAGNPHLLVSSDYNYRPALEKLKQHAGEGAYTFTLKPSYVDGFDDEPEEEDENWNLDQIEPDFLEFIDAREATDEELEAALQSSERSVLDKCIVTIELILRHLSETDPAWILPAEEVAATDDFRSFLESLSLEDNQEEDEKTAEALFDKIQHLINHNEIDEKETKELFATFKQHANKENAALVLLNLMPLQVIIDNWEETHRQLNTFPPLVRTALLLIATAENLPVEKSDVDFFEQSRTVAEAFSEGRAVTGLHHRIYWMAKLMLAIQRDNKEQVQHYHALVANSELPPGQFKFSYALQLVKYLKNQLEKKEARSEDG